MPYSIGQNIPGYLPMADEPSVFEDFQSAQRALIEDMERSADSADAVGERALGDELAGAQQDVNLWSGPDSIVVVDPEREHDLGTVYWINEISEDDYREAMDEGF